MEILNPERLARITLWRMFILDTESSGYIGCPVFHPSHRIIQLSCICLLDQDRFNYYIKYKDGFKIPAASTEIHHITNAMIQEKGEYLEVVLKLFIDWILSKTYHQQTNTYITPVFIAHCAKFDRDLLYKFLSTVFTCGKEGIDLGFVFIDSHELAVILFPEVRDNAYDPSYQNDTLKGQPYKLQSLIKHFYGKILGEFHNSEFDCKCLAKLFMEKFLPKIWEEITDNENWRSRTPGVLKLRDCPLNPAPLNIVHRLSDIKGTYHYIENITEWVNKDFILHGEPWKFYETNENMIHTGHLLLYGWMKTLDIISVKDKSDQPIDSWHTIIQMIEGLFRFFINIYSDELIVEILSYVCNRTPTELYNSTTKELDDTPLFPSFPGLPVSYLPFKVSIQDANLLYTKFGFKTVHDLYIDREIHKETGTTTGWIMKILNKLSPEARVNFTESICNDNFELIIPRFKQG